MPDERITQTDADGNVVWEGYPPDEIVTAGQLALLREAAAGWPEPNRYTDACDYIDGEFRRLRAKVAALEGDIAIHEQNFEESARRCYAAEAKVAALEEAGDGLWEASKTVPPWRADEAWARFWDARARWREIRNG